MNTPLAELEAQVETLETQLAKVRALVMDDALKGPSGAYPDMACHLFPKIVQLVGVRMNVPAEAIVGPRRTSAIVAARHVATWICYQVPRATGIEVGVFMNRCPSSTQYTVGVIANERSLGTSLGRTADRLLAEAAQMFHFEPKGFGYVQPT